MLNKIKNSLVIQSSFFVLLSIVFIALLWIFFYFSEKHQQEEHDMSRYFHTVHTILPIILKQQEIKNENLELHGMRLYKNLEKKPFEILFEEGDSKNGYRVLNISNKRVLHIYTSKAETYLEDTHKDKKIFLIHIVFLLLLTFQTILYIKLTSTLKPLSLLSKKLKALEKGDLSALEIDSKYSEIKQIKESYNQSISQIDYMLETREMFNKIFMHEMKMPLAKGMFYLELEPSKESHKELQKILDTINNELEEFSQIEALITYKNSINNTKHKFLEILESAKKRALANKDSIEIKNCTECFLTGDKEFWILAIKNLIDNALKYSSDKKLKIDCKDGICFINKGDALPVDISSDIKKWKIEKGKRHKSSTGYGFGLFIIKNIVLLNNYKLEYTYDKKNSLIKLKIKQ